jgi:PAS domain S-box-containing protein
MGGKDRRADLVRGFALRLLPMILLAFLTLFQDSAEARRPLRPEKGFLDLSGWNFHSDGPVSLSGEWAFCWNRLVSPEDFESAHGPGKTGYIHLPGSWHGTEVNGQELSGMGCGTYLLKIALKNPGEAMAFKFLTVGTAFQFIVNGKSVTSVGTVATSSREGGPEWSPHVAILRDDADLLQVMVHVSNFHHRKGGIGTDIQFGLARGIIEVREKSIASELFLSGAILIVGLYHLCLFALRRKDKAPLHFGIFCALIAVYTLLSGERFFSLIFTESSWALRLKLTNLTSFMSVPFFLLFLHSLFPGESRKRVLGFFTISLSALSCVVVLTSAAFYTRFISLYHVLTLLAGLHSVLVLVSATRKRREGATVFLTGFVLFFVVVLNDVLYDQGIIRTGQFVGTGLLIFIFFQSVLLALRFAGAFSLSERQQQELQRTNESLNREIAERKVAEKALVHSEEKYRLVAENINDNIWIWDLTRERFTYASPSVKDLLGYTPEEMQSLALAKVVSPSFLEPAMRRISELASGLSGSTPSTLLELELLKKDGSKVWAEVRGSLLRNQEGRVDRILGVTRDISARKQAESLQIAKLEAEASSKTKSEFLATMSHELRTPLNHIIGFTELVADGVVGDLNETQKEYLNDALSSSRHLLSLINDVLDLSKVEAGKMTLDCSAVALRTLLEDSLTMVKDSAIKRSVHLDARVNGIPETIRADQRKLRQILFNLLGNAVKFTPDGGKVALEAQSVTLSADCSPCPAEPPLGPGDYVEISVRDTGIGIAPEDLGRLFKPFEQIRQSKGQAYPGTGLGLSLTRSLVELHGGRIWAESEGAGKGSAFRFVIPVTS